MFNAIGTQTITGPIPIVSTFREGDPVMVAEGPYQGTPGVFNHLRPDVKWADVTERNGRIRSHPVEWLEHTL